MLENVILKKVKVHDNLSEETVCFSAEVYQNGKLIAYVSNRGQGGCNDLHPAKGLTYDDIKHLDNLDAECELMTMAEEINIAKKYQSKAFVLIKNSEVSIYKTKLPFSTLKKYGNYKTWLDDMLKQFETQNYRVLNTNL